MKKDIEKFIKTYHRCQVKKPYRQSTSAPLQLMPIPESPSQNTQEPRIGLTSRSRLLPVQDGSQLKRLLSCSLRTSPTYMDFPRSLSQIAIQNSRLSSGNLCSRLWKPSYDSAQLFIQRRIDKQNA